MLFPQVKRNIYRELDERLITINGETISLIYRQDGTFEVTETLNDEEFDVYHKNTLEECLEIINTILAVKCWTIPFKKLTLDDLK